MGSPAVRVQGVGKRYLIGGSRERYRTLQDTIVKTAKAPFVRLRHPGAHTSRIETLWALRDVSFEMQTGEVLGIIGRNGAGKSTLLKVLSRITEPTEGQVELWGRVGSLLEVGTGFHPELTGRENILLNGAILGMRRAEIYTKFDEIVEFAELARFIDTPVKRYSSGMYVRLAFAVAAHLEPEILVVDEVLAVGDAAFQKKCLAKMSEASRGGRTVLFVSHNMTAVRGLCTRAMVLDAGRVTFDGAPIDAVTHYFGGSSENSPLCTWDDLSRAPGNERARLREVCVRDSLGAVSGELDIGSPFTLEVVYEVVKATQKVGVTFQVLNDEGVMILTTINNRDREWHGRSLAPGVYRSTCRIPGNFLGDGVHAVTLIVWKESYHLLTRQDEVVGFRVHDTGGIRGDYLDVYPGVVRPSLEWHTEQVSG